MRARERENSGNREEKGALPAAEDGRRWPSPARGGAEEVKSSGGLGKFLNPSADT